MIPLPFLLSIVFILGLLWGSFLNVVIYRLPEGKSVIFPRSRCGHCGSAIAWFFNLPVIGYLILKGKTACCQKKLSLQYPLVELASGVGFLGIGLFVWPDDPARLGVISFWTFFFFAATFLCFFAHIMIDLRHQLLMDKINIVLLLLFGSQALLNYPWQHWLIGALVGFLGPLAVTYLFYLIRGQVGLGGGDIKLYGILGLVLGPLGIVHCIFLSCSLGAVVGAGLITLKKIDRQTPVPFGPFIILVASVLLIKPEWSAQLQALLS